jgi:hypothetical protein
MSNSSTFWHADGSRGPAMPALTMIGMSRSCRWRRQGGRRESTLTWKQPAGKKVTAVVVLLLGLADPADRLHHVVRVHLIA